MTLFFVLGLALWLWFLSRLDPDGLATPRADDRARTQVPVDAANGL